MARRRRMFRRRNLSFDSYEDNYETFHNDYESDDSYPNFEFKESISQKSQYNDSFNEIPINIDIQNFDINLKDMNIRLLDNKISELDLPLMKNQNILQLNDIIDNQKRLYVENKHEYLTKKKILVLLLNSGAAIFGGSIRDCITHDYGAILYYNFIPYLGIDYLLYCNKETNPESYEDRNTILNDIDTIMNMTVFETFLSILDDLKIKYHYYLFNNFKKYIDIIDNENEISKYIHLEIKIDNEFDINNLEKFSCSKFLERNLYFKSYKTCNIKIDILICKENIPIKKVVETITFNSDFYCNSLFIFNNKLQINKEIAKKLKEVLIESLYEDEIKRNIDIFLKEKLYNSEVINIVKKQIIEKKAISLNLSKKIELRINKIKAKGFRIICKQDIYDIIKCKDEICLICRSEISEEIEIVKYKCCNSYYHEECLVDYMNKKEINKCFVCSKSIDSKILKMLF